MYKSKERGQTLLKNLRHRAIVKKSTNKRIRIVIEVVVGIREERKEIEIETKIRTGTRAESVVEVGVENVTVIAIKNLDHLRNSIEIAEDLVPDHPLLILPHTLPRKSRTNLVVITNITIIVNHISTTTKVPNMARSNSFT